MKRGTKLSDEQFLSILRENAGLFARTARAIKKQFGIEYSRQAVRDRAENHSEVLSDIYEENLDIAEEGLYSLMRSKNENIKIKSIQYYLDSKGKKRGYVKRSEYTGKEGEPLIPKNEIDYSKLSDETLREIANAAIN
jgi:hypothetical protein